MFRIKIKCTWRCGCLGCFLLLGHQEDGNKRNYEKNTRSLWWNPSFCVWSNGISLLSPLWDWRRFYEPVKVQTNLNVHIWRSLQFSALKSAYPVFGWHFFWFLVFSFVLYVFFFILHQKAYLHMLIICSWYHISQQIDACVVCICQCFSICPCMQASSFRCKISRG